MTLQKRAYGELAPKTVLLSVLLGARNCVTQCVLKSIQNQLVDWLSGNKKLKSIYSLKNYI